jgi:flagellar hook protein FlgE
VNQLSISADGTISETTKNGQTIASYKIPLANVVSPDNLTPLAGDVYQVSPASGNAFVGTAGDGGFGTIASSSLESSTVDLATQLTEMIVAQRGYEANSKVFQAGSDLLTQLNNILK